MKSEPEIKEYRVTWIMELDATSPEDAAKEALAIHRDPDSLATCFDIEDLSTGKHRFIDALEDVD